MLAPTRDLARDLNQRARAAILDGAQPSVEVPLVDGSVASVGDVIITRHNDRRLGVSATDWVKNGDRWSITGIRDGALDARHTGSGLRTTLPASYVAAHVELGYASTVHTAQGLTADVMHGIVTGEESRQVLYTMMTRGRHANHAHLVVSAGSDAEQLALPGIVEELTATETLERILSNDGATKSASTTAIQASSPAARLHDAAIRYADALVVATQRVPGAADETAVEGPLPWLSAIPESVTEHQTWSRYLEARARLVTDLADEVRASVTTAPPEWARRFDDILTPDLVAEIAVWRAASDIDAEERTLIGPPASGEQEAFYQRRLVRRLNARYGEVLAGWEERVVDRVGHRDERTIELAKVLEQLSRRGIDAEGVLDRAVAHRPLPDDHATAALEFRVRQLVRPTHPGKRIRANRETGIDPSRRPDPPNAGHGIGL